MNAAVTIAAVLAAMCLHLTWLAAAYRIERNAARAKATRLGFEAEDAECAARYWEDAHDKGVAAWKQRAMDAEAAIEQMHAEVRRVEGNADTALRLVLTEVEELAAYKTPEDPAWNDGAETMRGAVVRLMRGWTTEVPA